MGFKFILARLQSLGIGLNFSKQAAELSGLLRCQSSMLVKIDGSMGDDSRPFCIFTGREA
jgi:hypothetical protein